MYRRVLYDITTSNLQVTNQRSINISSGTLNLSTGLTSANARISNINVTNISSNNIIVADNYTLGAIQLGASINSTTSNINLYGPFTDGYGYIQVGSSTNTTNANLRFTRWGTTNSTLANFQVYSEKSVFLGGNVGIGTTSPSRLLSLSGPHSNSVNGPHIWINTSDSPVNPVFQQLNWSADNVSLNFDMYYDGSFFKNSNSSTAWQIYKLGNQMKFTYQNGTAGSSNGQLNAMVLGSTGNIGIGGTAPAYTLDVNGTLEASNSNGLMLFASSGNLGIGTTAPTTRLDVFGNSPIVTIRSSDNTNGKIYFGNSSHGVGRNGSIGTLTNGNDVILWTNGAGASVGFATQLTERMRITDTGNVGIGTISPNERLEVAGTLKISSNTTPTNDNLAVYMYNQSGVGPTIAGSQFEVRTNGNNPRLRIDGSGNVGIGTTSPGGILHLNNVALFTSTGNLTCTGDIISFGSLSDIRLKKDVESIDIEKAIDVVSRLRGVTFKWREDVFNENKRNTNDIGFIAQEIEEIIPEAVSEYKEITSKELYKNIKHEKIIPYLLVTIQYLLDKINK